MNILSKIIETIRQIKPKYYGVLFLIITLFSMLPLNQAKLEFGTSSVVTAVNQATFFPEVSAAELDGSETISTRYKNQFELIIPKIDLDHKVISNVHPGIKAVYGPVLEKYIAHGKYTKLPNQATEEGNVYLFAHRQGRDPKTGEDFGFFRNLHLLGEGDTAQIKYQGKTYTYKYLRSFVIQPEDTWVYTSESAEPELTLQTCENGESQRLMVKFRLVSVS